MEAGLSTCLPAEFLKDPTDAIPNSVGRLLMLPGARLLPRPLHFIMTMLPVTHPSEYVTESARACACATCRRSRGLGSHDKLLKRSLWTQYWQAPEPEGCTRGESNLLHSCSFSLHPYITIKWQREDTGAQKKPPRPQSCKTTPHTTLALHNNSINHLIITCWVLEHKQWSCVLDNFWLLKKKKKISHLDAMAMWIIL